MIMPRNGKRRSQNMIISSKSWNPSRLRAASNLGRMQAFPSISTVGWIKSLRGKLSPDTAWVVNEILFDLDALDRISNFAPFCRSPGVQVQRVPRLVWVRPQSPDGCVWLRNRMKGTKRSGKLYSPSRLLFLREMFDVMVRSLGTSGLCCDSVSRRSNPSTSMPSLSHEMLQSCDFQNISGGKNARTTEMLRIGRS